MYLWSNVLMPMSMGRPKTVDAVEEEEEERSLIIDLKRHARLAVAWSRHGSLVPRWT